MKRKVLRILLLGFFSATVFGFLAVLFSEAFSLGIFVSIGVAGALLMGVACPKCGSPVLLREQVAFGSRFKAFSPWPPKDCSHCGFPLTENEAGAAKQNTEQG